MVLLHSVAEEEGGGRYEEKRGGDGVETTCFDYLNRAPSISLISNTETAYNVSVNDLFIWFRYSEFGFVRSSLSKKSKSVRPQRCTEILL